MISGWVNFHEHLTYPIVSENICVKKSFKTSKGSQSCKKTE